MAESTANRMKRPGQGEAAAPRGTLAGLLECLTQVQNAWPSSEAKSRLIEVGLPKVGKRFFGRRRILDPNLQASVIADAFLELSERRAWESPHCLLRDADRVLNKLTMRVYRNVFVRHAPQRQSASQYASMGMNPLDAATNREERQEALFALVLEVLKSTAQHPYGDLLKSWFTAPNPKLPSDQRSTRCLRFLKREVLSYCDKLLSRVPRDSVSYALLVDIRSVASVTKHGARGFRKFIQELSVYTTAALREGASVEHAHGNRETSSHAP